ncbi:MAG: hypothetical protein ACTJFR_04360 [Canibacter sp.]
MKLRTRIAGLLAAVTAAVLSVFTAVPAFAHGEEEKIDTLAPFTHAGEPANWIAIAIIMVVLLAVVLFTATGLSNLFNKKSN